MRLPHLERRVNQGDLKGRACFICGVGLFVFKMAREARAESLVY